MAEPALEKYKDSTTDKLKKDFTKKVGQHTLIYPSDSAGDAFYPEAIKFTVYRRLGASLKTIMGALGEVGSSMGAAMGLSDKSPTEQLDQEYVAMEADLVRTKMIPEGDRGDSEKALIAKIKSDMAHNRNLKQKIKANPNMNAVQFLYEEREKFMEIATEATKGMRQQSYLKLQEGEKSSQLREIYLNMPNEITFTDAADWAGTDLGMVGGLAKGEAGEAGLGGLFSNFANVVGGGTGALASLALKMGTGGAAAGAVLGMLGGTGLQKSLESGTGQVANPYKEMTFNGIGFREFTFNFIFRARNQPEVTTIQDIITTFRHYSKPIYTAGESGFFSYPEEFHIEFLTKTNTRSNNKKDFENFVQNEYIPGIKMCVCKNVTTNFAAQNAWRSLENGAPVEISLALTFEETELVTGEDVIGSTQVGRFKDSNRRF
jgi:hypothetical protein